MIYNEKISSEYGSSGIILIGDYPEPYKPSPSKKEYDSGYIVRWFAKRINDEKIIEINPEKRENINKNLYSILSVTWKISGTKNNYIENKILQNSGVFEENSQEIERIEMESKWNLSRVLSDKLEFWRGY